MWKIIDLSYSLDEKPGIPGHPKLETIPITTHQVHGRSNTGLRVSAHLGTHVDSPYHFYPAGNSIEEVPLDLLIGPCIKIDLRGILRPQGDITKYMISDSLTKFPNDLLLNDKILMMHTGWMDVCGGYHDKSFYTKNWILSVEAAELIVNIGFKALAIDFPIDRANPQGPKPGDAPSHRMLLGNGIPLIENLVNIEKITEQVFVLVAAPIKLVGFDGSPARVFAIEGII